MSNWGKGGIITLKLAKAPSSTPSLFVVQDMLITPMRLFFFHYVYLLGCYTPPPYTSLLV